VTPKERLDRRALAPELLDCDLWPGVDVESLPEQDKQRFEARRQAVVAFMRGEPPVKIKDAFGVLKKDLYRYVNRCLEVHADGRIWGFRALIPYKRTKGYERNTDAPPASSGGAGLFMQLLREHPDIQEAIDDSYLKRKRSGVVHESRIPLKALHKKFLGLCRQAGIGSMQYPFTSKDLGLRSLTQYCRRLSQREIAAATRARKGDEAARLLQVTGPEQAAAPITRPYQRVQFDGHRIDAIFAVESPTPDGGTVTQVLERMWLLTIMDVASRAVLGYYLSLHAEYSAIDVLQCIRRAIVPWQPKDLNIPGLTYPEDGGLPSGVIPALAWALWDEMAYDNGKANLSAIVRDRLTQVVGCGVNPGPVAAPEVRGIIERFFRRLEEAGFHRLPSTTGSGPADMRRREPEKAAVRYHILLSHLDDLLDILIADYNGTPHSSLSYQSPLERLRRYAAEHSDWIRSLPAGSRNAVNLFSLRVTRFVRGNVAHGRRPYVTYEGGRYQNAVLARMPDLIGKPLSLVVNVEDLRSVTAYLPDGSELGPLTAPGGWGRTPHDLSVRQAINRLRNRQILRYAENADPVQVYMDYLAKKGQSQKRTRNQLQHLRRTVGELEPDAKPPETQPDQVPALPVAQQPNPASPRKARKAIVF
jgi:transposase InsO family protein